MPECGSPVSNNIAGRDSLPEEGCIRSIVHPDPQRGTYDSNARASALFPEMVTTLAILHVCAILTLPERRHSGDVVLLNYYPPQSTQVDAAGATLNG